jgi:hypothetical protein
METVIRDIDKLSPADRKAVESLLGRCIAGKAELVLLLVDDLTAEQRKRWDALMASIAPFHENVRASGASPQQLEDEIDRTISEVRSGQS